MQKLSPTASSFFPLHAQPPTHAPTSDLDLLRREKSRESTLFYFQPSTHTPAGDDQNLGYIHPLLSTDTGLSRCLIISRLGGGTVGEADVENYISVNVTISYK